MAEQMRPASPQQAPDPANSYERAKPDNESGAGRLDAEKTVPHEVPDQSDQATPNRKDPTRQVNAQDTNKH